MSEVTEILGEVTVSSGALIAIDCGLLGMWSHDRPPLVPEGVLDPETTESVNAGTDFEVVGRDALEAGRAFGRQWDPLRVYDIPRHGVAATEASFREAIAAHGLDAELRPLPARVPHRRRVDRAIEHGGGAGEVFFHGITGVVVAGLPRDRALSVHGVRMGRGDFPDCWHHVEVRVRPVPATAEPRLELVGTVAVDRARILLADADALGAWEHEDPCDGKADYVFWGADAAEAARAASAPALGDGQFGWRDEPVERAVELGTAVEQLREERGLRFAGDFRPHSHHYLILDRMRTSATESGTIEVGGATLCAFFTLWGDGFFPVYRVLDGEELVAVRIVLGTEEAARAMRAVNA